MLFLTLCSHKREEELKSRNGCIVCDHLSICAAHVNILAFDRPGAKMNDASENSAYSGDKSLFSKLP